MGIGLGGFVDGIVLHQILQWHHMLTDTGDYPPTTIAGLEANTLADGLFHALDLGVRRSPAMLLAVRAWQRRELAPPWRVAFGLLARRLGRVQPRRGRHRPPHPRHPPRPRRPRRPARLGPRRSSRSAPCWSIGGLLLARSGDKIAAEHSIRQAARAKA